MNVGANGFLDKNELSVVCEHIGMDGMDEDVSIFGIRSTDMFVKNKFLKKRFFIPVYL